MKKLILTEEERNEILTMHKNAIKNQYLTEQTVVSFESSDARDVHELFNTKFLPTVIPGYFNMTPPQAIDAINKLTEEQLSGTIKFFTENGYKQPNNPKIIKYQQELMKNTNISTFTSADSTATKFDDGTFGIATAKASLEVRKRNLMKLPKDKTLEQISIMNKEASKTKETIQAPKIKTGPDIRIEKGTQPIK